MSIGLMFLVASGMLVAGILAGGMRPRLWLATTLAGMISAHAAAVFVLGGGADWEWRS